jgi:hypothetical protein
MFHAIRLTLMSGYEEGEPVLARSRRLGRAAAAYLLAQRKTDDQSVAAYRASPFLAVAVRRIRAGGGLRVKLLEELIFAAVGAVPVQVRHPRDLLVAGHQGTCSVGFADGSNVIDPDVGTISR